MFPVRYIHAADVHLDASFKGLRRQNASLPSELEHILTTATFTALDRLVNLCEREKPDFLVLAGDIYNEEDQSLKAQLALRDACVRLSQSHIPVYIVHGNHDPLCSRLQMIEWPDNTHIFQGDVHSHVLMSARRETEEESFSEHALAIIHGISHTNNRESRNLAKAFSRLGGEHADVFQLGVLHCAVESMPDADRYAPCSVADLHNTGLDAWALGHVHQKAVLSPYPFVAYSGNTQGLHINEQGVRGCYMVTAQPASSGATPPFSIHEEFHPLSSVVWEQVTLSLEEVAHITQVEERIIEALEELSTAAQAQTQAIMVRVCLQGHTTLDATLRYTEACTELTQRIQQNQSFTKQQPIVWLKDIVMETTPLLLLEELVKRDDLLGETLRLHATLQEDTQDGKKFVERALAPLFGHTRAKTVLTKPTEEEMTKILEDAARLCADMMESK